MSEDQEWPLPDDEQRAQIQGIIKELEELAVALAQEDGGWLAMAARAARHYLAWVDQETVGLELASASSS